MICKAATNKTHTLLIEYDEAPWDPREGGGNFGRMVCFHRRYSLGDSHSFHEPDGFLQNILTQEQFIQPIFDFIKRGGSDNVKLAYERHEREWQLLYYGDFTKRWYAEASFAPGLSCSNIPDTFLDAALSWLPIADMLTILKSTGAFVILPLYLYDHSGITMSTSTFSCPWDSGQVGWIYADHDMILREYGEVTDSTIEKATALLEAEVKHYDTYLTGQCYGFRLFEGEEETDSCWGFLGDVDELEDELKANLPAECKSLVEALEYCTAKSEADYFYSLERAG